jgi:hypothetical protein
MVSAWDCKVKMATAGDVALDKDGPVSRKLIDIVSSAASDRWLNFGMTLLRTSMAEVQNVTSVLASPNALSPKNKLQKILEE